MKRQFTKTEITLALFTNNFINSLVKEFNLTPEKKEKLRLLAIDDLAKLYENNDVK